jgi:hypothetical protein
MRIGQGLAASLLSLALLTACTPEERQPLQTGAAPPPPPAGAGELIEPLETWGGATATVEVQSTMRAATAEEWRTLWQLAGVTPPRPLAVGREIASGVFLGRRPTGGFGVEILGLQPEPGTHEVVWREHTPPRDAVVTQALTTPWQIAVFPAEVIHTGFSGVR